MEQILKVLKSEEYDRYIFITYEEDNIVGLNFHQGITEKDEHIDYYFSKPCPYTTETFMRMINNIPIYNKKQEEIYEIINDAIEVVCSVINYNQCISYYMIRCDDSKRPSNILPDKHFELDDLIGLQNYLEICNAHKLNYDLVIEEFDKNNEEVTKNIYLINKNHLNN
jgi:hypothetical protein